MLVFPNENLQDVFDSVQPGSVSWQRAITA